MKCCFPEIEIRSSVDLCSFQILLLFKSHGNPWGLRDQIFQLYVNCAVFHGCVVVFLRWILLSQFKTRPYSSFQGLLYSRNSSQTLLYCKKHSAKRCIDESNQVFTGFPALQPFLLNLWTSTRSSLKYEIRICTLATLTGKTLMRWCFTNKGKIREILLPVT